MPIRIRGGATILEHSDRQAGVVCGARGALDHQIGGDAAEDDATDALSKKLVEQTRPKKWIDVLLCDDQLVCARR